MTIEQVLVVAYLVACVLVGFVASRKAGSSHEEYWVAGRNIGTFVNALAIMAALASGGSVLGVMGLAYSRGIPATLALFAGAVVGFPLAAILVARPLRRFGKYTITDFLRFRYPHPSLHYLVPLAIVATFTAYIVAQMKAAGMAAEVLLGIPYAQALTVAAVVFILYVSVGGMIAITWTDVVQGALMLIVVVGTAVAIALREGAPLAVLERATQLDAELGMSASQDPAGYIGYFVIWASAIPVVPHIVMRVFTAKDANSARVSLNVAMIAYSVMIVTAVLAVVPMAKLAFPDLADPDLLFLKVMETQFSPVVRGVAVAAVLAAVMSTTDGLLLACSSAVAHDLLGDRVDERTRPKLAAAIRIGTTWVIGAVALLLAYSPPALLSEYYTAAIGLLSATLFVPTIAGLWWRRANTAGGVAAFCLGGGVYLAMTFKILVLPLSPILLALPASFLGMWLGGRWGRAEEPARLRAVEALHRGS